MKNVFNIKTCLDYSLYYVRELILVNFNVSNIDGGIYTKYPAKNLESYRELLKHNLASYSLETQNNLENILSTSYSYSKSLKNYLSNTYINSTFYSLYKISNISSDILSTLIQYNSALYGISSSYNNLYQNHSDIFSFIFNGNNDFKNAILILREKYNDELYIQKTTIIIYFAINSSIILIIYSIFTYFMVSSYISAAKRRVFYIKIFYGINPDTIRDISSNCEKLINKLKKDKQKNNMEEDIEQDSYEGKSILKKNNLNENSSINNPLKNSNTFKNKIKLSTSSKLFFIFYIIAIIGMYAFFPYNSFFYIK